MTATETLQQAIQGVLTEKALSAEAIGAVQTILKENEELHKTRDSLQTENARLNTDMGKLREENTMWKARAEEIERKEYEVIEREFKQELNDLKVVHANERANDLKEIVGLVFKNSSIRKSITAQVVTPAGPKDQYGQTIYPTTSTVQNSEVISEE